MPNLGPLAKALLRNKSYFKALALEPKPINELVKTVPEMSNPTLMKAIIKWLPRKVEKTAENVPSGIDFPSGFPSKLTINEKENAGPLTVLHEIAHTRLRPEDPNMLAYTRDWADSQVNPREYLGSLLPETTPKWLQRDLAYRLVPEELQADAQAAYHLWNLRNLITGQRPLPGMRGHIRRELPLRLVEKTQTGDPMFAWPAPTRPEHFISRLRAPLQTKLF